MAKGQMRSNKEKRKPKADKSKKKPATSSFATSPGQSGSMPQGKKP